MSKPVTRILWAEDSIGDILLIKEAFRQADLSPQLNVVNNGADAINYLFRRGRYARAHRPDLIILDMNMPKRNGREVIEEMKTEPELIAIPMVVLTSSNQDQDVLAGYDPKRCLYIVKPTSFQALVDLAKKIHNFWLSLTSRKPEP